MKTFIGISLFLFALIAPGDSIKCKVCENRNGTFCAGEEEIECPAEMTACRNSLVKLHYVGENPAYSVFKKCAEHQGKDNLYSELLRGVIYNLLEKYCKTDLCNKEDLQLPDVDDTPNGVKCPACYVEGATSCDAGTDVVECTGDMKKCIYVGATLRTSEAPSFLSAYRGCVNIESAALFPTFPGLTVGHVVNLEVTDGV